MITLKGIRILRGKKHVVMKNGIFPWTTVVAGIRKWEL
jgi:hypothetical protein